MENLKIEEKIFNEIKNKFEETRYDIVEWINFSGCKLKILPYTNKYDS